MRSSKLFFRCSSAFLDAGETRIVKKTDTENFEKKSSIIHIYS